MHTIDTERARLLVQLERILEWPLVLLSLVWVVIAVIELTHGLSRTGEIASIAIWSIFVADFLLKLVIAPRKVHFVRRNWIAALTLLLPAFRLLRVGRALRLVRIARGVRLAKLLGSLNRGMRALRRALHRRAAGYVTATTLLVLLVGAAGMMVFEREGPNRELFETYPASLWWTAMLMTTIASESWPRTGAGRALTLFLSLYSVAVFGYITASLASFFVEQAPTSERPTTDQRPAVAD
ncbi:MAG TPA: ion transporter [Thermoanaerobaculia bacterium]|nr:ion transporter [Thermoanaerobaculia bacterium]